METKVRPDVPWAADSGRVSPGHGHPPLLLPFLGGELSLHQSPLTQHLGDARNLRFLRQGTEDGGYWGLHQPDRPRRLPAGGALDEAGPQQHQAENTSRLVHDDRGGDEQRLV